MGSLIIIVECKMLEILEGLWNDYSIGYLNEMVYEYFVIDNIFKEFGFIEVKFIIVILMKEYKVC